MANSSFDYEYVNHPNHYQFGPESAYEVIKIIEALEMDFHLGNTFKYIARAGKKEIDTEIQDLRKASWYLQRKIELLESKK